MRKSFIACKCRKTAKRKCPWASRIQKAEEGYWCYESISDYILFKQNNSNKIGTK